MSEATPPKILRHIVPPVCTAIVLGAIGAISIWLQEPFLVPSLGSAAFLQILTPRSPSARAWPMMVGQLLGAACGFAGVFLAGSQGMPHFMGNSPLVVQRAMAAGLAALLTAVLQQVFKATNAAGGATALVVAVGAETATLTGAGRLLVGIILVTALGEAFRQVTLRLR